MHPCLTPFPSAERFFVAIVPSFSCFLFDIEVLYQVDKVCGKTHLYHDIEQLVVAYIAKGLAVINKTDEGSFFGLSFSIMIWSAQIKSAVPRLFPFVVSWV